MTRYSLDDLLYLMSRLRDPKDGCSWDIEQSFSTIISYTIEECYELAEAIEENNVQQIQEELGDVLFQVIFYSQLGKEQGWFQLDDIVSNLVAKLIRRHPHVFPDGTLTSRVHEQTVNITQIKKTWEDIKLSERESKQQTGVLDDIPRALPALTRAIKLQKRASQVGFDWSDIDGVIDKISEEVGELQAARGKENHEQITEEYGDLLFAIVNLGRHLQVDSETALRATNQKFKQRFAYIEKELSQKQITPDDATLEEMDKLWDEAKTKGL